MHSKTYHCPIQAIPIIQEVDGIGRHRLCKGDVVSEWVGYRSIATLGDYKGTTEYYEGIFPRVFGVIECI